MNRPDVIDCVKKQLIADYNCTEKDLESYKLVVTELKNGGERAMKAVCFGGSAVFSVKPSMVPDFKRIFEGKDPNWVFESKSLIMLSEILYLHGHNVDNIYEYYVPDTSLPKTEAKYDVEIIESGFDRFKNEPAAKDVFDLESHGPITLVLAARKNGKIIGMAAAFEESPLLWRVSIGIVPEERFGFAAENVLALIKDAVIEKGKVPYYGGPSSRNISPSTGSAAGFFPCWTQIQSRPRDDEFLNLHGTR